jgi:hypothetical protein
MNKTRMTFTADRHKVNEGEIVEINWSCDGADTVQLTIDNGLRSSSIPLPSEGSKRFRLNRSKGRTWLKLTVTIQGKEYSKKIGVRVKPMPTTRAETVDSQGRPQSGVARWWQRTLTNWHNWRARIRYAVQALPEGKQMALKVLAVLTLTLFIGAIWPRLAGIAILLPVIYLVVVLLRR